MNGRGSFGYLVSVLLILCVQGARIMIQDTILTPQVQSLLPTLELQGATYQLVASKLVRGTGKQGRYLLMQQPKVRAYYIRENVKTANLSVKQELEKLGCFDGILPSKIAARMELTVSPIATYGSSKNSYPLSFLLSGQEIELIKENGNVGCGFIPQNCKSCNTVYRDFRYLTNYACRP